MKNIYESQEFFEHAIRQWMDFLVVSEKWAVSYGLTLHSFWMLYQLHYKKAGMKQIELVKATQLSKQTISYLTSELQKKGYVKYCKDGVHKRVIQLTREGYALMDRILQEVKEVGLISTNVFSLEESESMDRQMTLYLARTMEGFARKTKERMAQKAEQAKQTQQ